METDERENGRRLAGGLKYSSKDGLELNKGEIRKIDTESEIFSAQTAGDDKFLEEAALDHNKVMDDVFDEKNKNAFKNEEPEGWSEDDAIPFEWRKPEADVYPILSRYPVPTTRRSWTARACRVSSTTPSRGGPRGS